MSNIGKFHVATLGEKVKILRMRDVEYKPISMIAALTNIHLNTVREIIKSRNKIITNYCVGPKVATCIDSIRNDMLGKVEAALDSFVLEKKKELVVVNSLRLERQALIFYEKFRAEMKIPIPVVLNPGFSLSTLYAASEETKYAMSWSRDKLLVKVEKALSQWVIDMTEKYGHVDGKAIRDMAMMIHKELKPDNVETKPFLADIGWLNRFSRKFILKSVVESSVAKKYQQHEMEKQKPAVGGKTHLPQKGVENDEAQSSHQQVTTRKCQQGNHQQLKSARENSMVLTAQQKSLLPNQRVQPTFQQEETVTIIIDDDDEIKIEEIKSEPSEPSTMQIDPLEDSSDGGTKVEIKSELEDDLISNSPAQEILVPVDIKCEAGVEEVMLENMAVEDIKQEEEEPVNQDNCSCEENNDDFINKRHFPMSKRRSPITNTNYVRYVQWECRNCEKDGIKKITMYRCTACPEEPGLCIECFIPWHVSVKNFRTN